MIRKLEGTSLECIRSAVKKIVVLREFTLRGIQLVSVIFLCKFRWWFKVTIVNRMEG